jgi:transcriptional regulator with XRE-family HTH domain
MKYGERLQELREKTGMTQEQLADRSGVKLWTLRGYEQGRREPSWKAALALAGALGVAAEAFADCEEGTADGADQQAKRPRGRPRKDTQHPVAPPPTEAKATGKKAPAPAATPSTPPAADLEAQEEATDGKPAAKKPGKGKR